MHNEALQLLDLVVAAAVDEPPQAYPPALPAVGSCYLVAASASGAWAGKEQCLAAYTSGGWRFVQPVEAMTAFVKSTGTWAAYRNETWEVGQLRGSSLIIGGQQVVGERAAAIALPTGGTTVDSLARSAISEIIAALRHHGLVES